ncbi:hypothetical protein HD806DRAFT_491517, partial [Xylariaceae sp. AK1471]
MMSRFSEGLHISFKRRLCVTKNGYIGLGPPLTCVEDLVKAKTGSAAREETGVLQCRLVGECYLHGMMDREMVRLDNMPLWFHL